MILLTSDYERSPVYVNPADIGRMQWVRGSIGMSPSATVIHMLSGGTINVLETPEEIIRLMEAKK